jgi:LPXTG-site transpeptidase (sortase) family protein
VIRARRAPLALLALAVLADVGVLGGASVVLGQQEVATPAAVGSPAPQATEVRVARGAAAALQDPSEPRVLGRSTAVPQRILIPAIGVDAPVQRLGRNAAGVLRPPTRWASAGWYAKGVVPGDIGAAVIAGHLDTTQRAAVFVNLRRLRPGDHIAVRMSDAEVVRFTVTRTRLVRKALFPTSAVYGPTPDPELRLITCNEPFDATQGAYADNLVVFATAI